MNSNFWRSNRLDVYIWDVGHGLSVTVISPVVNLYPSVQLHRRRVVQIDAGKNGQYDFFPASHLVHNRGLEDIDCLILTHPDKDHIDDLPNVDTLMKQGKLRIHTLLRNRTFPIHEISENASEESRAKNIYRDLHQRYNGIAQPHHHLKPEYFGGVHFHTTHLAYREGMTSNNASIVVSFRFGNTQIIIPGDLEASGTRELIETGKMPAPVPNTYRILIAPHHGRESAEPRELLNFYRPSIVLASAQEGDEYTDRIYSDDRYVSGHSVKRSTGEIMSNCKFNATKGKALHIEADLLYPFISRIEYEKKQKDNSDATSALFNLLYNKKPKPLS